MIFHLFHQLENKILDCGEFCALYRSEKERFTPRCTNPLYRFF
ncbi:hypothetical protein N646_4323 [Vibrio alginolyticus NBRC 15630 = ATCC 17749]|uniref:Uncharacterized protein n=1 Tax=Vibrio alginolyticus (strain ATCC 17749 / DSM 2171 / NBRC 15630 / NCIMB 1903 / NCTC 12160 / XII-53) TaxID=1219076 RepID=A0A2I3CRE1_VIBAX|nr:hypothetical protein N646_4323 [Vibrio alginolyticus NBRC 15630 = ATCC 17749]